MFVEIDITDIAEKPFAIFNLDCTEQEYDPEQGYGNYPIIEAEYFTSQKERDKRFRELMGATLPAPFLSEASAKMKEAIELIRSATVHTATVGDAEKLEECNNLLDKAYIELCRFTEDDRGYLTVN